MINIKQIIILVIKINDHGVSFFIFLKQGIVKREGVVG